MSDVRPEVSVHQRQALSASAVLRAPFLLGAPDRGDGVSEAHAVQRRLERLALRRWVQAPVALVSMQARRGHPDQFLDPIFHSSPFFLAFATRRAMFG